MLTAIIKGLKKLASVTAWVVGYAVAIIFLVELLYRFYLFGWDGLSAEKVNSVHQTAWGGILQASPYPEIAFELKPNLDIYFKMARLKTNSAGLRDREYPLAKPENTVRVAVIGDSYTMPAGVAIEDAYHTLLEDRFNRNRAGVSYEFINFGVGSYDLRQYLAVIQNKALAYSPDLILIGFCASNDYQISPEELYRTPFQPLRKTHPFFTLLSLKMFTHRTGSAPATEITDKEKEYMRGMFYRIKALSQQTKIPVVVAYLSNRPEPDEDVVRRIVEGNGLYYVDTSAAFNVRDFSKYIIYATDGHPNAAANKIFAQRIYEYLRAKHLL